MSNADTLEAYMLRMELPHEKHSDDTSVVEPECPTGIQIIAPADEPTMPDSAAVLAVTAATRDQLALFRRLLEFNDTTLHCAYALDGDQILLSGAHQVADLDFGEFQAMIEDMAMALDGHLEQLTPWRPAPASEGI